MPTPTIFRTSITIAALALLEVTAGALVATATLLLLAEIQNAPLTPVLTALTLLVFVLGLLLLRPRTGDTPASIVNPVSYALVLAVSWSAMLATILAFAYVAGISNEFPRRVALPWALLSPVLILAAWVGINALKRRVMLSQRNVRTAVIAGVNDSGLSLADKLAAHPEHCIRLEGFFDDRGTDRLGPLDGHQHIGGLRDMANYVRANRVDIIFISLPIRHIKRVMELLDELRDTTASMYFVPDVFVFDLIQARNAEIVGVPVVAMCETPFFGHRAALKRMTDLAVTIPVILLALPLMIGIAIAIRLTSPGPAIFRQRRYGLDGREIVVYKFRSMHVTEDGPHVPQAQRDDPRITSIGRFLRKYSLDELPQLFNVLEGTMSLVGPRPHAIAHNEHYRRMIKGYMIRHKVLPGITGLAQVNGFRGETSDVEQMQGRIDFDLDYLRHWTPLLDLKILFLTGVRLFSDDVY